MKLSSSLLQAITLGVSVTAIATATTSCEKKDLKQNKAKISDNRSGESGSTATHTDCPACGMG
jgi:hypothetical protein